MRGDGIDPQIARLLLQVDVAERAERQLVFRDVGRVRRVEHERGADAVADVALGAEVDRAARDEALAAAGHEEAALRRSQRDRAERLRLHRVDEQVAGIGYLDEVDVAERAGRREARGDRRGDGEALLRAGAGVSAEVDEARGAASERVQLRVVEAEEL